jgi:hypothetical protein
MSFGNLLRRLALVILCSVIVAAQESPQGNKASTAQSTAQKAATPQPNDELSQIRDDLNRMDSLNTNMSTEIEFLHDQNLQILLRTNSQMWTILIRDMRRQLQLEEQRRAVAPVAPKR